MNIQELANTWWHNIENNDREKLIIKHGFYAHDRDGFYLYKDVDINEIILYMYEKECLYIINEEEQKEFYKSA